MSEEQTTQSNLKSPEALKPLSIARAPHRDFIQKLLIVVLFALVLVILWQGAEVLLLVFAGLLLAVFLRGLSDFLSRHTPLSDGWALSLILLAIAGLIWLGVWLLSDSMQTQFEDLSKQLPAALEQGRQAIAQYPFGRRVLEQIPPPQQWMQQQGNVFGRITGFVSSAFDAVVNFVIVLITGIYFAFNPRLYNEGIIKLVPKAREQRAREILYTIGFTLRRFLLGITASMAINGTITAVGLWFIGVPFAVPLGIITALFNFIPNIGPIAASVPAILIAFAQSPTDALYVALLYLFVQNFDGFVTTPLVQQKAISIPPVLVIAAQLLLGVIFGFLGLLLAVPLAAIAFVLVKMIYVEDVLDRRVEVKGEDEAKETV